MNVHVIQHVPFEDEGIIRDWAIEKGFEITRTCLYENQPLPEIDFIDFLLIMGGPMNIYEEQEYPWIVREKKFIKETIDAGKKVLGICLGAQLIGDVLGGKVVQNEFKEIGWFEIDLEPNICSDKILTGFPKKFTGFLWHGDRFEIPDETKLIGKSRGCKNQGFILGDKVVALQFHLESTREGINKLVEKCGDEIIDGKYIQKKIQIIGDASKINESNKLMYRLLDNMIQG